MSDVLASHALAIQMPLLDVPHGRAQHLATRHYILSERSISVSLSNAQVTVVSLWSSTFVASSFRPVVFKLHLYSSIYMHNWLWFSVLPSNGSASRCLIVLVLRFLKGWVLLWFNTVFCQAFKPDNAHVHT
jgi:hypothetical protein